jgi:hypothetical protein
MSIEEFLGAEFFELIERDNSLRLLHVCDVEVAYGPNGWGAVAGGRTIVSSDIDIVIRRALAVSRGRHDLWPKTPLVLSGTDALGCSLATLA